jgi:predicted kinase
VLIIFGGRSGGKTTIARELARELGAVYLRTLHVNIQCRRGGDPSRKKRASGR